MDFINYELSSCNIKINILSYKAASIMSTWVYIVSWPFHTKIHLIGYSYQRWMRYVIRKLDSINRRLFTEG